MLLSSLSPKPSDNYSFQSRYREIHGSGKSSLISALLGEMKTLSGVANTRGKIAYVPQQAKFSIYKLSNLKQQKSEKNVLINTQYMTNPTIVSLVKMEYGWNFSISGLKLMVKSGLEEIFLKFLHVLPFSIKWIYLIERRNFDRKYKFSNMTWLAPRGISKTFFLDHFSPSFLGQKC